ncbi:MAG: TerB family tellurite resistance protein [Synergistaceae bacterium]|nr:TerB family tellurite resistance protein [Synergistaceae bacterium]
MTVLSVTQLGNLLGIRSGKGVITTLLKRGLFSAAKRAGYIVVPYILPEYVEVSGDSLVTLIDDEPGEVFSPSFADAHLLVELGMAVAMGNGRYEPSEIRQLSYTLEMNFVFTELEIRALTALKELSCISPPDIDRVAEMLSKRFLLDERREIARMMTTVGAAGSIGSGKIIALRKLYAAVEIDERELYQLMMGYRFTDFGVIEVKRMFAPRAEEPRLRRGPVIKLDLDAMATKKRETESVGAILSEIFASGE